MKNKYDVVVGNIGTVFSGANKREALLVYSSYLKDSKSGTGNAGHEDVTLFANSEPIREHQPAFNWDFLQ
jgi:hypothetical protein